VGGSEFIMGRTPDYPCGIGVNCRDILPKQIPRCLAMLCTITCCAA
jgi:hypothetical protein